MVVFDTCADCVPGIGGCSDASLDDADVAAAAGRDVGTRDEDDDGSDWDELVKGRNKAEAAGSVDWTVLIEHFLFVLCSRFSVSAGKPGRLQCP